MSWLSRARTWWVVACSGVMVTVSCAPDQAPGADAVEIGLEKQLFIDDLIVEATNGITRVLNRPRKHAGNPVLKPERDWEGNFISPSSVIYDQDEGLLKMWYVPNRITAERPPKPLEEYENLFRSSNYKEELDLSCYAISRDGLNWERPDLGMVEFEGSSRNNIFSAKSVRSDGGLYSAGRAPNAFKDVREKDPDRRYKALGYALSAKGQTGICLYFSRDGLSWNEYKGNPVMLATGDTHTVLGWDPSREKYVAYLRPGWKTYEEAVGTDVNVSDEVRTASITHQPLDELSPLAGSRRKRTIGFSESEDFVRWTPIEPALIPDEADPVDLQFYGMPALQYAGFYLGFPWVFRTNALTIEPQFAFSRDGKAFSRMSDRTGFIPLGANGTWDDACIYGRQPIVHDGRIWFYYLGVNWAHGVEDLLAEGENSQGAVGVATLPIDGFVSLDAGPNPGTVTTHPLVFKGSCLVVTFEDSQKGSAGMDNVSTLRAEILDWTGKVIEGFEVDQSETINRSGSEESVSWKGGGDLSRLAGQPVRIRFHLLNGKLYSFQFL